MYHVVWQHTEGLTFAICIGQKSTHAENGYHETMQGIWSTEGLHRLLQAREVQQGKGVFQCHVRVW